MTFSVQELRTKGMVSALSLSVPRRLLAQTRGGCRLKVRGCRASGMTRHFPNAILDLGESSFQGGAQMVIVRLWLYPRLKEACDA